MSIKKRQLELPFDSEKVLENRLNNGAILDFEKSKTQQAFKSFVDRNNIMAKYQKTGLLEHVSMMQGRYVDLSSSTDFQDAVTKVAFAQQSFDTLPSEIRARFGNNAALFLDFVQDPKNADALVDMGLATKPIPTYEAAESAPKSATSAASTSAQAE